MFQSPRYPHIFLRCSLAIVFLWFGIDKMIHPQYWLDAWVPHGVVAAAHIIGMEGINVIYLVGLFEVLVAASFLSGFFVRIFSIAAFLFVAATLLVHGVSEVLVRDIGILGALAALAFWPERPR